MPDFQPFVPASQKPPEFTLRAVLLGASFGIIFGAVTVYVGLRAGLTVAASIPIAVISISFLRDKGKVSILECIIVQTAGNAGQSIAAGVIFTLPALIFLGFDLEYSRIFMLALIGGYLGVLFMVPLRRPLIVEEHGNLKFPEGTACADVFMAGAKGGSFASRVFFGLGLGALYTFFQNEIPLRRVARHAGVSARLRPAARAQRRIHQGRRHAGVSRRGLHHWRAHRGHHVRRRRLFLARAHAAHLLLRQGSAASHLSRHRAHRADGPQRSVDHLHSPHGRGRRGRRRTHHALQNAAHHRRRAALRLQAIAARLGRRGASPSARSATSP